jgi:hypothetical protein
MYDFAIYDKRTGNITGHFSASSNELLPNPLSEHEAFAEVVAPEHREVLANARSAQHVARGTVKDGAVAELRSEPRMAGRLVLSVNATDRDGDGRPELPADGKATTTIRAEAVDNDGKPVKRAQRVRFEVSRGTLARRDATTKGGAAEVQLTSTVETTECRVLATAKGFESFPLVLEFIPPDEFKELQAGGETARVDRPIRPGPATM